MDMFRQTFLDGVGKTNKGWTVMASFAGQVIAISVLILIPLIFTDVLPKAQAVSMLTAPPPTPPPPAPPPPVQKVIVKQPPRQFDGRRLTAPKEIPKQVAVIQEEALSLSDSSAVVGPSSIPGEASPRIFDAIGIAPPPPVRPPVVMEAKQTTPRIVVTSILQSAKLIKKPVPAYPPLARQARIQGTVKFTAIIGKDGAIQNLTLVSGHSLLVPNAQDAVKQWVYQPTLLNGEPVEVVTEIDVNFALSQ